MTYKDVDEWLNEPEGFGLRFERTPDSSYSWLKEAWRLGAEAERERCANVAINRALRLRAKAKQQRSPSKQSYFSQAIEARVIADAIKLTGTG